MPVPTTSQKIADKIFVLTKELLRGTPVTEERILRYSVQMADALVGMVSEVVSGHVNDHEVENHGRDARDY